MPLSAYQTVVTSNSPQGTDFMDATAPTYLVTELQDLKATVRQLSLSLPWQSLVGLQGNGWTGGLAWTFIGATQASVQGDQSVATGTALLKVGQRVRAFVTAGTIYGILTQVVASGGITTATFVWDVGSLDTGLTDIQFAGDPSAAAGGWNVYSVTVGNPAVDVLNTTTETAIYTIAIPGNTMGLNGALRLTLLGDVLHDTSGTIRWRAKFGGVSPTTILDSNVQTPVTSATNRSTAKVVVEIQNIGATNLQHVQGQLFLSDATSQTVGNGFWQANINNNWPMIGEYVGLAIDTTVSQTLTVTVQWSAANNLLEYRQYRGILELFV